MKTTHVQPGSSPETAPESSHNMHWPDATDQVHSDSLKISFKHVLPPDAAIDVEVEVRVDDAGAISVSVEVPVGHGKLTFTAGVDVDACTKLVNELSHAVAVVRSKERDARAKQAMDAVDDEIRARGLGAAFGLDDTKGGAR